MDRSDGNVVFPCLSVGGGGSVPLVEATRRAAVAMREDMMAVLGGGGLRGMMKRGETEIECSWPRWETQSNDLFTVRPSVRTHAHFPSGSDFRRGALSVCGVCVA